MPELTRSLEPTVLLETQKQIDTLLKNLEKTASAAELLDTSRVDLTTAASKVQELAATLGETSEALSRLSAALTSLTPKSIGKKLDKMRDEQAASLRSVADANQALEEAVAEKLDRVGKAAERLESEAAQLTNFEAKLSSRAQELDSLRELLSQVSLNTRKADKLAEDLAALDPEAIRHEFGTIRTGVESGLKKIHSEVAKWGPSVQCLQANASKIESCSERISDKTAAFNDRADSLKNVSESLMTRVRVVDDATQKLETGVSGLKELKADLESLAGQLKELTPAAIQEQLKTVQDQVDGLKIEFIKEFKKIHEVIRKSDNDQQSRQSWTLGILLVTTLFTIIIALTMKH